MTVDLQQKVQKLLTPELKELLTQLHKNFDPERQKLLAIRKIRQQDFNQGALPTYINDHPASKMSWQVATIPDDLSERRVEITGPVNNAKMVLNMLNENEQGIVADMAMLDFEDSMAPTWQNIIDGIYNVKQVAEGTLSYTKVATDKTPEKIYTLNPNKMAKMMVRVRGLHLNEANICINGKPIAAGVFDLAMCAAHSAATQIKQKQTPKFYIPKCEHYLEARWWNKVFSAIEEHLHLPHASLRVTFLIETLPAAFQMEEILYEIRERACGLNGGRWDKIFSDIKVLREHKDKIFADRALIDMKCPWMDNYAKRLIKICHKHGAFAMGGMSAFTPGKDAETRARQTQKVIDDKAREASIGHDGCWVSHPYFIAIAREQFKKKNQLDVKLEDFPDQPDLIPQATKPQTLQGLRTNIRVAIAYQKGWDEGIGCVAFDGLMEDLATLEISRAQVWQWLHHKIMLDNGILVTPELVSKIFDEEAEKIIQEDPANKLPYLLAKEAVCKLFLEKELRDFFHADTNQIGGHYEARSINITTGMENEFTLAGN